jgi:hypothetical protein
VVVLRACVRPGWCEIFPFLSIASTVKMYRAQELLYKGSTTPEIYSPLNSKLFIVLVVISKRIGRD